MRSYHRSIFCFTALVLLILVSTSLASAKTWKVYPGWTRAAIQAVIDTAKDGDVIHFTSGIYNFNDALAFTDPGALQLIDKSLTIKGAAGAIIMGAPTTYDENGGQIGITCFWVLNPLTKKTVVFDGLTMETFKRGINSANKNEAGYCSNLTDLTIKNCTFTDISYIAICAEGTQRNITIVNNRISGPSTMRSFGMFIDWHQTPGGYLEWQPKNTLVTINNNSIRNFIFGIVLQQVTNVLVNGNNISNDSSRGVGIFFGGNKNSALVANNTLSNLRIGIEAGEVGLGWDLEIGRGLTVKHNNLSNIWFIGISLSGYHVSSNSVVYNTINMQGFLGDEPSRNSSGIYTEGYNDQFKNNIIRGIGKSAIILGGWDKTADGGPIYGAHNELFKDNSVAGFTGLEEYWCHYWLNPYTHDNIVIGLPTENATAIDEGINNRFTYVNPPYAYAATTLRSGDSMKLGIAAKKEAAKGRRALTI